MHRETLWLVAGIAKVAVIAAAGGESVYGSEGTATGRQQCYACGAASGAEGQSSCAVRDSLSINDYDLPEESPAETGTLSRSVCPPPDAASISEQSCTPHRANWSPGCRDAQSTANEMGVSSKDQSLKPISLKLLSEGGYYDMPMSVRLVCLYLMPCMPGRAFSVQQMSIFRPADEHFPCSRNAPRH